MLKLNTAMFAIYRALRALGYNEAVMLDTEDTDSYVQASYASLHSSGSLCIKRKNQIIFAQSLCDQEIAKVLIPLHVLTGCDQNSGFYGQGKKLVEEVHYPAPTR